MTRLQRIGGAFRLQTNETYQNILPILCKTKEFFVELIYAGRS